MAKNGEAEKREEAVPSFLDSGSLQLILFGGKGGVGKTTCATAAALRLAAHLPERTFLLVSADPAHSLADSFAASLPPANLTVLELDAQQCLATFRAEHGHTLQRIAAAGTFLDDEDIRRFLSLSLPGLDELMAFLRICGWVEQRLYDCIIVDTAPSGHALRLVGMPALLHNWLSALDALLAKSRYMRKVFGRSSSPDDLDAFLSDWWTSMKRMSRLLRDGARCRFVPVTIAETLSVHETAALLAELRRGQICVRDIVINQVHPAASCPNCGSARTLEEEQVQWLRAAAGSLRFWIVERFADEVRGREWLDRFWVQARLLATPTMAWRGPARVRHLAVPAPAMLPSSDVRLLLFAGKGGVGKTTLACATAVRLAAEFPERRILLFSTDPAHSLSACLAAQVGPSAFSLMAGLSAMEIDARAEFEALKRRYASDIRDFFQSVSASLDLTFDRVVLEKMLDLAPPGLDEVMALGRVSDLLAQDRYELIVLDPAATGHFIRLLELPAIADQWLKTMFDFLLKYERVFTLPGFSEQLVRFSKNLKQFRRILSDPRRAVVYAVGIAAEMAWEEMKDLLDACGRIGVEVPAIFLNLLTPPGDCAWCAAARRREETMSARFRDTFPRQRQILIYRQEQPLGLNGLRRFGSELFQAARQERPALEAVR